METTSNNEVIDHPDYYDLPCKRQVEDYIWFKHLLFWAGNAVKYSRRAGHKNGEPYEKDRAKVMHYATYRAEHDKKHRSVHFWFGVLDGLIEEMLGWDGNEESLSPLPEDLQ